MDIGRDDKAVVEIKDMKKLLLFIHNKFSWKTTITVFMVLLALSMSLYGTLYKYFINTPKGFTHTLEHNNLNDYYYYLSLMRQGYEGKWFLTSRHTPEIYPGKFAQTFFALTGRLGHLFGGNMPITYFIVRTITASILLLMIYALAKRVLKKPWLVLTASFFAFFGTSFWYYQGKQYISYLSFWTEFSATYRTTFIPHHVAATALIIASLLTLDRFFAKQKKNHLYLFILFGVLAGICNPASLLNYMITLAASIPLVALVSKRKDYTPLAIAYGSGLSTFGLVMLYFAGIQNSVFPWTTYRDFSANLSFTLPVKNYILGMGPLLILALFSIPLFVKKTISPLWLIILSWALTPFISIFVLAPILGIPNSHFFQAAHYIPLSILAALGFQTLFQKMQKRHFYLLAGFLFAFLIPYFGYSWYKDITREIHMYDGHPFNIYVPQQLLDTFTFLNKNTPEDTVVLSGPYIAGLLPAYTHDRSLHGHPVNSYHVEEKNQEVSRFYKQENTQYAKALINKYDIDYIIFSLDAPRANKSFVNSLGLKKIYENSWVVTYQTKQENQVTK